MNDYELDILKLKNQGFCCAQIIVHMALDVQGVQNPGLIRAMTGLCRGLLFAKGVCGALNGGACVLALYAGKGGADEEPNERLPLMLAELARRFEQLAVPRFGSIHCADIVSDYKPDMAICGGLISHCFGDAMAILTDNGFDPAHPAHDPA